MKVRVLQIETMNTSLPGANKIPPFFIKVRVHVSLPQIETMNTSLPGANKIRPFFTQNTNTKIPPFFPENTNMYYNPVEFIMSGALRKLGIVQLCVQHGTGC